MVDTIKGYYDADFEGKHFLDLGKLNDLVPDSEGDQSRMYTIGTFTFITSWFRNKNPNQPKRIYMEGSIPNLVHATNSGNEERMTLGQALMILTRMTGLPIVDFKLTRLDFGVNIPTNYEPDAYLNLFDSVKGYQKDFYKSSSKTLYFQTEKRSRVLTFYDKRREIENEIKRIEKKKPNAEEQDRVGFLKRRLKSLPKNLLRFEYRVFGTLADKFKRLLSSQDIQQAIGKHRQSRKKLKRWFTYKKNSRAGTEYDLYLHDLLIPEVLAILYDVVLEEFERIDKNRKKVFRNISTPEELVNYYINLGLEKDGGQDAFRRRINQLKKRGIYSTAFMRKVSQAIEVAPQCETILEDPPELREIESKIRQIVDLGKKDKLNYLSYPHL